MSYDYYLEPPDVWDDNDCNCECDGEAEKDCDCDCHDEGCGSCKSAKGCRCDELYDQARDERG